MAACDGSQEPLSRMGEQMKLNNDLRRTSTWDVTRESPSVTSTASTDDNETATTQTIQEAQDEEPNIILELSLEALKKTAKKENPFNVDLSTAKSTDKSNNLDDSTGRLTRMLVASRSVQEVQAVISQAYKNLGDVLKAAAGGDEKAMGIMKRLHKLIRRANRKVSDLTKEDTMRKKQKRAEKDRLEQLAKEIEDELKRRIARRKDREKKYLTDWHLPADRKQNATNDPSISVLESKLKSIEIALNSSVEPSAASIAPTDVSISGSSGSEQSSENIEE